MNRYLLFPFFFLICWVNSLCAQWLYLNGPVDRVGNVESIAVIDSNIFAGTTDGGVLLSSLDGKGWTRIDSGLSSSIVYSLMVNGRNIFAGTWGGAFLSTNNGTSWMDVSTGLEYNPVLSFAVNDSFIFAGTYYGGVYRSSNNGTNWTAAGLGYNSAYCLLVNGSNISAGTWGGGVFLSTNNGTSWTAVNNGLINNGVYSLAADGPNILAGTNSGVCLSTNNGTSWIAVDNGLTNIPILSLAVNGSNIFAGTYQGGAFLSTNNGTSWRSINDGLSINSVYSFAINGSTIFAGSEYGVWKRPLSEITGMQNESAVTPKCFLLAQNYPNPFNPSTTISFGLPSRSFVSLKVFDFLGEEVATLVAEQLLAGYYSQQWHLSGIASGVYFYRLQAGQYSETRKLILLR